MPCSAQAILVELQLGSLSELFIEGVVSTTMATLYGALAAPLMAAYEVALIVYELAPISPMKFSGTVACCSTLTTL